MKKIMLLATVVAMSLAVAMPVNAQSRKDKKAAKKAQWEMQQQQQKEEAELRHQMKMDSLRAVQEEKEAAKAREQAARDAAAREAAEEKQISRMEATVKLPCEFYDDDEWFYAFGARRFDLNRISTTPAALLRSTQRQLRDKLAGAYKQALRDYFDQMDTEEGSYEREHIESAGDMVINQLVNETREVCRERSKYPDAEGKYTMYMAVKVSKKEIVERVVNTISEDQQLKVRFNEKQFRDSAFKVFEEESKKEYSDFKDQQ